MQLDLNGHYCLANKLHYDKLVKDGYEAAMPFNDSGLWLVIGSGSFIHKYHYSAEHLEREQYKPMHLHKNEWVEGSLEHKNTIALSFEDVVNLNETISTEERKVGAVYSKNTNTTTVNTCAGCEHEGMADNPSSICSSCIRGGWVKDEYTPKTGDKG